MLFSLSDTIEGVKCAGFLQGSLIYMDRNGNVVSKNRSDSQVIARNIKRFEIAMSYIFCFTGEYNLEIYRKGELIKQLDGPLSPMPFFDLVNSVVLMKERGEEETFFLLDADLNAVPYDWKEPSVQRVLGDYFFVRRFQIFSCHRLSDGQELWRFDVYEISGETEGYVTRDLILLDERLFISLVDGTLLCLDVATGRVIEKLRFGKSRIKLHEGSIYGVEELEVGVLDPDTLKWRTIDFSAALKDQGFKIQRNHFILQGDELYFMNQTSFSEDPAFVCAIKLSTPGLIWYAGIPIGEGNYWLDDLNVQGDTLFVLDQGYKLRVFQRNPQ